MDNSNFQYQPVRNKLIPKFFLFAGLLFVGTVAVVSAVLLPGALKLDDRSKAASSANCTTTMAAPAALCGEKCISNDDCTSGLVCTRESGTTGVGSCRSKENPTSPTCSTSATTVPTASPSQPTATLSPSAPPGCIYKEVQCIQAPCNPVLVCPTPLASIQPTKSPSSHVVKVVFHVYSGGQNMAIDYIKDGASIIDDSSPVLTYGGTWTKGSDSSPYGGTYATTSTHGSSVSYKTASPTIIVRPYRYPTRGGLDIYVDDVLTKSVTDLNSGSGWTEIVVQVSK